MIKQLMCLCAQQNVRYAKHPLCLRDLLFAGRQDRAFQILMHCVYGQDDTGIILGEYFS